jgi:DNA (cytosine-5)-methyltransferase 1
VPNLGDVTEIDADAVEPVDLIVFGSPCQSFSVAGKRLGLDDPRGNLALVALRLVGRIRPAWVVFENVPGLLSSDGGRDFGAFLGLLGECGYGFAYRILDAQHAGVPQRRRRVFVVGYLCDRSVLTDAECVPDG